MGRRIVLVAEILVTLTLFSMFASLIITSSTNDRIIETTEEFAELVRYKGCITDDMYYEFLNSFETPVEISFEVEKSVDKYDETKGKKLEFTRDVTDAIKDETTSPRNTYCMDVGDNIKIIVRTLSSNYYNQIIAGASGTAAGNQHPIVAEKGGMVLNTQY